MIRDYRCNRSGTALPPAVTDGFAFPAVYADPKQIANLAGRRREYTHDALCMLPFCHTLEAEAMGAKIRLDDGSPRAGDALCDTIDELLSLPAMDFHTPRMQATLQACRILRREGESVVFAISGPFTILNSLADLTVVFRAMRKEPQKFCALMEKLSGEILRMIDAASSSGVDLISYADSAAAIGILGPKNMTAITRSVTLPLLREAEKAVASEQMLVLCPKTALALIDSDCAQWRLHTLREPMNYGQACLSMRGKVKISGQCCIQSAGTMLSNRAFREILLK